MEQNKKKYIQAKEALIQLFHDKNYQNGQKIPTENEIIETTGFSRNTIRQAVMELQRDGVVRKEQGRGTFYISQDNQEKTGRIGVINFFLNLSIYPNMVHGIEEVAWQEGYTLLPTNTGAGGEREIEAIDRIVAQGVDGIIYEPSHDLEEKRVEEGTKVLNYFNKLNIPVVTTHFSLPSLECSSVLIDDEMIGYNAVRYLHEMGHRNIGIFYIGDIRSGLSRTKGYEKAMKELGLTINPQWEVATKTGEYDIPAGERNPNLCKVFMGEDRPSAVFCFNDELAIILYEAARQAGITIGKDLSVVGVDNTASAGVIHPGLTTFDHPKEYLGRWAAQALIQRIKNPAGPQFQLMFQSKLVKRESVADLTKAE
ncbi:MAG: GntR family transcriptional regulator [Spirochaetales bacterium]|nr:GntR family transcriptional regulator [Spirochaetales bacterium]